MQSRSLTLLQELRDAIEGSDRLIAVIGPNAVKSEYIRAEWAVLETPDSRTIVTSDASGRVHFLRHIECAIRMI